MGINYSDNTKNTLVNFQDWDQKTHSKKWLIYPNNIGEFLSLDETEMSNGELYTILTNKLLQKEKKGAIVAIDDRRYKIREYNIRN